MKPDVVLFGELIPPEAHIRAETLATHCDVLLVVGTSATVYPGRGTAQHRQGQWRNGHRVQP